MTECMTLPMSVWWLLKFRYAHGLACWDAYEQTPRWRRICKRLLELFSFTGKNIVQYTPQLLRGDYYLQNWALDMLRPLASIWA